MRFYKGVQVLKDNEILFSSNTKLHPHVNIHELLEVLCRELGEERLGSLLKEKYSEIVKPENISLLLNQFLQLMSKSLGGKEHQSLVIGILK